MTEPAWFTALVDQRVALIKHAKLVGKLDVEMILTPLTEPPEHASQAVLDQWERSCDACGKYCPHPTPFYNGHKMLDVDGIQLTVIFGVCARHNWKAQSDE